MSASENEMIGIKGAATLADHLEAIAVQGEPCLSDDEQRQLDAAVAALRIQAPVNDNHPRADRVLEMQMLAIIAGAEVERGTDVRREIEAAGEHIQRALLALAVGESEVRYDA